MNWFWWILGFIYIVAAGMVAMMLIADGKPLWASLIAGLFWLPLLTYALFTGRM